MQIRQIVLNEPISSLEWACRKAMPAAVGLDCPCD